MIMIHTLKKLKHLLILNLNKIMGKEISPFFVRFPHRNHILYYKKN